MTRNPNRWIGFALVVLGNVGYALAVKLFLLPAGLISCGTTGIALAVNSLTQIPISRFIFCFNVVMLCLGWWFLGKRFALSTVFSSLFYPIALEVLNGLFPDVRITEEELLNVVFAGLGLGISLGAVMRGGASTGGMDIPPLILKKKFGLPVSVMLYAFDVTILILQMLFSDKEEILYGILLVMIYTVVLDRVLLIGTSQTQVKIVSKKYMEINEKIIHELDRGSTLIHATTGFMKKEQPIVMTVISNRELGALNRLVMETDPQAFMIVGNINEVKGRGFTQEKVYRKEA